MTPSCRGRWQKGQSLVEFALIVPILLAMCSATIDFARVYSAYINLQEATRNAAEFIATDKDITDVGAATTKAQELVCLEIMGVSPCTGAKSPTATATSFTCSPTCTADFPLATVTVKVTQDFSMIFPYYELLGKEAWTLTANITFSVIRNKA